VKVCAHCQHVRVITERDRFGEICGKTHECSVGERIATNPVTGRQAYLRQHCKDKNRLGDCTDYLEKLPKRASVKTLLQRLLAWRS